MTLIEQLEARIAQREAELVAWRAALEAIRRAMSTPALPTVGRQGRGRPRKHPAAGSLEDRIVSAAMGPTTLAAIVEASNARAGDARAAVRRLVKAGLLTKTGKSRGTRYVRS